MSLSFTTVNHDNWYCIYVIVYACNTDIQPLLNCGLKLKQLVNKPNRKNAMLDIFIMNLGQHYNAPFICPPICPYDPSASKPSDHCVPVWVFYTDPYTQPFRNYWTISPAWVWHQAVWWVDHSRDMGGVGGGGGGYLHQIRWLNFNPSWKRNWIHFTQLNLSVWGFRIYLG